MSLELRVAKTEEEKNFAFEIRYKIFCEEMHYLDPEKFPDKKETDNYDALNTTLQMLLIYDNLAIATVRLILPSNTLADSSKYGLPIEELIDLSEYKQRDIKLAEPSRSSILKEHRKGMTLMNLWRLLVQCAHNNNITHFVTTSHPKDIKLYSKLGFEIIAAEKPFSAVSNNPAVSYLLDLGKLNEPYMSFFNKKGDNIFL